MPVEPVPSRVTFWPTATSVASAVIAATTCWAVKAAPVMTTSSPSLPPLDDVTMTSAGGALRPETVNRCEVPLVSCTADGYPVSVNVAAGSPDWASTISDLVSLS